MNEEYIFTDHDNIIIHSSTGIFNILHSLTFAVENSDLKSYLQNSDLKEVGWNLVPSE